MVNFLFHNYNCLFIMQSGTSLSKDIFFDIGKRLELNRTAALRDGGYIL